MSDDGDEPQVVLRALEPVTKSLEEQLQDLAKDATPRLADLIPEAEKDRVYAMVQEFEASERATHRLHALSLAASVVALVPEAAAALLPAPKRFDCPRCRRAKLQRSAAMNYCQRCAYTEKKR